MTAMHTGTSLRARGGRYGVRCAAACLCVLLLGVAKASAATLGLGSANGTPGGATVVLPVTLTPDTAETVVAFQLDLGFDAAFLTLANIALGPASTAASKTLSVNTLGPGAVRVLVAGINQTAIAGGDVLDISVQVNSGATGITDISLSGVVLADPTGHSVPVTTANGTITAEVVVQRPHSADSNRDFKISLSELLRVVQFYNIKAMHCDGVSEDGFAPGPGDQTCTPYDGDYNPRDWKVALSELIRIIQFYNAAGYSQNAAGEDGFVPIF